MGDPSEWPGWPCARSHPRLRLTAPPSPAIGPAAHRGEVAEWLKAADCKSARASVRWFESSPLHHCEQWRGLKCAQKRRASVNRSSLQPSKLF